MRLVGQRKAPAVLPPERAMLPIVEKKNCFGAQDRAERVRSRDFLPLPAFGALHRPCRTEWLYRLRYFIALCM